MYKIFGLFVALTAISSPALAADQPAKFVIRWAVAHDPGNQRVLESVEHFGAQLKAQSKGEIQVVLNHFTRGDINLHRLALNKVRSGELEMSQVATSVVARYVPELGVLDLPFLFRDHGHATKVLDGAPGKRLLGAVREGTYGKLRAFDFTYSGGFRQVYGAREIHKIEDFRGLRLAESNNAMGFELFDLLGSQLVEVAGNKAEVAAAFQDGRIEAEEGEYNRLGTMQRNFSGKSPVTVVNETNHSLFLTTIVINEKFFQSLPKNYQEMVKTAAHQMAVAERAISIEQGNGNRAELEGKGVKIVKMSAAEQKRFEKAVQPIYQRHQRNLGKLVSEIKALR